MPVTGRHDDGVRRFAERARLEPGRDHGRRRELPALRLDTGHRRRHGRDLPGWVSGRVRGARDGTTTDICVMGVDGTGLLRLTTDPRDRSVPRVVAGRDDDRLRQRGQARARRSTVLEDRGDLHRAGQRWHAKRVDTQQRVRRGAVLCPRWQDDRGQSFRGLSDDERGRRQRKSFRIRIGGFTPRWSPDGRMIAFSYYKDIPDRLQVQLGDGFSDRPLVIVAVADVSSHRVTRLTGVGMATDLNTPQWIDNDHLFILRVPPTGSARSFANKGQHRRVERPPDAEKPGPLAGPGFGLDAPEGAGSLVRPIRASQRVQPAARRGARGPSSS